MFTVYFDYIVGFLSPDGQVGGAREPSSDRLHLGALLLPRSPSRRIVIETFNSYL